MVLPVCGWLEHGFYQFSPNFFRSMDGKYLELCQMYIFEPYSGSLQIWNAKELTNCTYYENLKGRYLCWAVYTKKSEFDEIDFLENTQQGVYKRAWDNTETDLTKLRESMSVFSKFKNDALKKYAFLKRYYMKSKRINVHEIGKL